MSLNPQVFAAQPDHPGKIKHLFLRPASASAEQDYAPCFYVEARIDYADVRSGYHMTCGLNNILDVRPFEEDLLWTRDMVRNVDPAALLTSKPEQARLRSLPEFVAEEVLPRIETQYFSFLLRHAGVRVFRNFALNIYSHPGETRDEFEVRCLDVFSESFRGELDSFREVVNRRLERIETKYFGRGRTMEFESDRRMTQARSRFHAVAEGVAELFLQTELTSATADAEGSRYPDPTRPDLEQALEALEADVRRDIRRLLDSYQERVRNIDEYIIHPGLKDLHLVRTCILWMPVEALKS